MRPRTLSAVLAWAGARSGMLPLPAMALGLLVPPAADALFTVLGWVSAATVFCALMAMERGGAPRADWRAAARMWPMLALCAPCLAWGAGHAIGSGPEAPAWMALVAGAPASAVAVANTAALGRPARPGALLVLLGTLLAPLSLPLVAWLFAAGSTIAPADLARRAVLMVLTPAALAGLLRRVAALTDGAILRRTDWKGIAALALATLALARMHGVADQVRGDPAGAAWAALLGVLACGAGAGPALLVAWPAGRPGAVLVGVCKGGALAWALVAPDLPPQGHLFMALTVLPIYGAPPLVALACRRGTKAPGLPSAPVSAISRALPARRQ